MRIYVGQKTKMRLSKFEPLNEYFIFAVSDLSMHIVLPLGLSRFQKNLIQSIVENICDIQDLDSLRLIERLVMRLNEKRSEELTLGSLSEVRHH